MTHHLYPMGNSDTETEVKIVVSDSAINVQIFIFVSQLEEEWMEGKILHDLCGNGRQRRSRSTSPTERNCRGTPHIPGSQCLVYIRGPQSPSLCHGAYFQARLPSF